MNVQPLEPKHWPQVQVIYLEGIATGNATFEAEAPEWERWDTAHLQVARLGAVTPEGQVLGWVALSPVSSRCVYAGVAEVSVYVAEAARGRGLGRSLMEAAIDAAEAAGIWTLQAGVFPENLASVALLQSVGFRVIGRRERLGKMRDRWRDVLLLERRSRRVGCEPIE